MARVGPKVGNGGLLVAAASIISCPETRKPPDAWPRQYNEDSPRTTRTPLVFNKASARLDRTLHNSEAAQGARASASSDYGTCKLARRAATVNQRRTPRKAEPVQRTKLGFGGASNQVRSCRPDSEQPWPPFFLREGPSRPRLLVRLGFRRAAPGHCQCQFPQKFWIGPGLITPPRPAGGSWLRA
jgi:hypothetical protein